MHKSPEDRYWSKIKRGADKNDCWEWNASVVGGASGVGYGYGKLVVNGKLVLAHRFSWELHNKQPIPAGLIIRHRCDNPPCTNPLHLEPGTIKDNAQDAVVRGKLHTTACKYGHLWSEENTYYSKSPSLNGRIKRTCKACVRRRQQEMYRRKKMVVSNE